MKRLSCARTRQVALLGQAIFASALVIFASVSAASAAPSGAGTLTDVANAYKATSAGWITTALGYAQHLFFALVAIELAWTAITYVLQRESISDFVAQVVLKLMGVFFFLMLLQNAPVWMPYIINSFSQAGATIGGHGVVLDPSATFGQGLQLAKNMLGTVNNPSFFTAMMAVLIAVLSALGVVIAFGVVAGQLMVTLIESYIVISAGIFFLGFSGSRWTLPFSEKYVAYAVSVGIKLFMLYLIVGLGQTLASEWAALFTPSVIAAPDVYIGVAGSALIFMLLGWHIPGLAASVMNGSPIMTLGTAASTVGTTVAGGAALAAGGLAAAGAVAGALVNPQRLERVQHAASAAGFGVITGERGSSGAPMSGPAPSARQTNAQPTAASASGVGGGMNAENSGASSAGDTTKTEPKADPSVAQASEQATDTSIGNDAGGNVTGTKQPTQSTPPISPRFADPPKNQTGQSRSRPMPSVLDILRSIRPPSLPNDSAGGTIHIRFKHHDAE